MATRAEVELFLERWRNACKVAVDFVPREKNIETLIELRMTKEQAKQSLRGLSVENYVSGPEKDESVQKGELWVFGLEIGGREIYIKVKVYQANGLECAKCVSFHIAERSLRYPYAGR